MSAPPTITPVAISIAPLQCTFHPSLTIHITIPPSSRPESGSLCRAVLRLDLPDAAFVDPDELEGRWGARTLISTNVVEASGGGSGNVGRGIRWDAWPEMIDIERAVRDRRTRRSAPASPSHAWSSSEKPGGDDELEEREGSSLWLSVPIDAHDEGVDELECESMSVDVDVPLHGRYLRPDDSGLVDINLFDASGEEHAGHRHIRAGMICEPPGRDAWLRQGSLLDLKTVALPTVYLQSPVILTLPTGHPSHQLPVELITAMVIWLGWAYLVRKLVQALSRQKRAVSQPSSDKPSNRQVKTEKRR